MAFVILVPCATNSFKEIPFEAGGTAAHYPVSNHDDETMVV